MRLSEELRQADGQRPGDKLGNAIKSGDDCRKSSKQFKGILEGAWPTRMGDISGAVIEDASEDFRQDMMRRELTANEAPHDFQ